MQFHKNVRNTHDDKSVASSMMWMKIFR